MRHQRLTATDIAAEVAIAAAWPNAAAEAVASQPAANNDRPAAAFAPTPAMPDVGIGVGRLVAGVYAALILVFFALFAGSPLALFAITVCAFFVAMFFAVPKIFLAVEADAARRPSFERFLKAGIDTVTGHASGRDAIVQMLVVPVLVTLGLTSIGIIGKVVIG